MKRLLFALAVMALLVWLSLPALASQSRPIEPGPITIYKLDLAKDPER